MNKELNDKLKEKYPALMIEMGGSPRTTCMSWGCECGDGWFNIIDALCGCIAGRLKSDQDNIDWQKRTDREVSEPISPVTVGQVKEKFGGLRFYYMGGDEEIAGMVSMAESMSYRTCEVCGAPGTSDGEGWVRTLCEEHKKPRKEEEKE